ncbi:hypothetical protein [Phaffia rhodozyma]|uniref:Uncharacterized protein n=1 Tax=Phaffia rhodozyma TaxID=264483 RepID=A0A0F7SKZ2_PHARH|nr:hypothetical protein [Phaffia rhodozyma]
MTRRRLETSRGPPVNDAYLQSLLRLRATPTSSDSVEISQIEKKSMSPGGPQGILPVLVRGSSSGRSPPGVARLSPWKRVSFPPPDSGEQRLVDLALMYGATVVETTFSEWRIVKTRAFAPGTRCNQLVVTSNLGHLIKRSSIGNQP